MDKNRWCRARGSRHLRNSPALPISRSNWREDRTFEDGYAADHSVLTNYVHAEGNVYIVGGTAALGDSASEAAARNGFLNAFGLEYSPYHNGVGGHLAIRSSDPLFSGVGTLYHDNGSSIVDPAPADPRNAILISSGGHGLYAIWEPADRPVVLAPGVVLLGVGAGLVGWMRQRRVL